MRVTYVLRHGGVQGMESYCVRAFAEALEVVPFTLAENAGLSPIAVSGALLRCWSCCVQFVIRRGIPTNATAMLHETIT